MSLRAPAGLVNPPPPPPGSPGHPAVNCAQAADSTNPSPRSAGDTERVNATQQKGFGTTADTPSAMSTVGAASASGALFNQAGNSPRARSLTILGTLCQQTSFLVTPTKRTSETKAPGQYRWRWPQRNPRRSKRSWTSKISYKSARGIGNPSRGRRELEISSGFCTGTRPLVSRSAISCAPAKVDTCTAWPVHPKRQSFLTPCLVSAKA